MSSQTNIRNAIFDQRFTRFPEVGVSRWHRHTDTQTDMATLWPTRPSGAESVKRKKKSYPQLNMHWQCILNVHPPPSHSLFSLGYISNPEKLAVANLPLVWAIRGTLSHSPHPGIPLYGSLWKAATWAFGKIRSLPHLGKHCLLCLLFSYKYRNIPHTHKTT